MPAVPHPDNDAAHLARLYGHIYEVVRRIPPGRVLTYGQVAELAGMPGAARVVGAAMRANQPAFGVPWQRVVGKRSPGLAQVSIHDPVGAAVQRGLLEDEGVVFSASGGIALRDHGWIPEEEGRGGRRSRRGAESKPARPQARRRRSKR